MTEAPDSAATSETGDSAGESSPGSSPPPMERVKESQKTQLQQQARQSTRTDVGRVHLSPPSRTLPLSRTASKSATPRPIRLTAMPRFPSLSALKSRKAVYETRDGTAAVVPWNAGTPSTRRVPPLTATRPSSSQLQSTPGMLNKGGPGGGVVGRSESEDDDGDEESESQGSSASSSGSEDDDDDDESMQASQQLMASTNVSSSSQGGPGDNGKGKGGKFAGYLSGLLHSKAKRHLM